MTIYSIYARNAEVEAVPDRFSWFAALLPPLYAVVHRLWLPLAGYVVLVVALVVLGPVIGEGSAFWLYVLLAVLIGFEASSLRRRSLRRRGYTYGGERVASAEEAAAQAFIEHAPPLK